MAATAFRKTENASWKKVRDILAQLQEKYGLAYAGVPRTAADAQKIVKENAGFVILKNAGEAFMSRRYVQDLELLTLMEKSLTLMRH